MRHIPEDELHAYLDQALSRSQCVEIESHLARCPACRDLRDELAALRDRTTALLARLGPPPILPPPFEVIQQRFAERHRRRLWISRIGWAASVALAVGLGWQAHELIHPAPASSAPKQPVTTIAIQAPVPAPTPPASAPATADPPAERQAPARTVQRPRAASRPSTPSTRPSSPPPSPVAPSVVASFEPASGEGRERLSVEVSSLASEKTRDLTAGFSGLWRRIPLDEAARRSESQLPRVPGLPVLQVQVRPDSDNQEIMAVDQQLASGEVIRTIEGPASRVSTLIAQADGADDSASTDRTGEPRDQMTLTVRQGDRMIAVTGPSAILSRLMTRVSPGRRY